MKSIFVREGESVQWEVGLDQNEEGDKFIQKMPQDIEERKK